jgi:hypothetical protein
MRPAIKVVGVDDQADPKLADLREGMIRYIENRSDASGFTSGAADSRWLAASAMSGCDRIRRRYDL